MKITEKYLNIPVSHQVDRAQMNFTVDGKVERLFDVRLAPDDPDYWVFIDLTQLRNKTITISYNGDNAGINKIYQSDKIEGQSHLYKEENRPQFHFTTRIGAINDPNGLVYYDDEYHLFYQHNPLEKWGGNQHWGHAVSKDLIHWQELAPGIYPDEKGVIYSGSAIIDYQNTSGFGTKNKPVMLAYYTTHGYDGSEVQCVAYSNDKGRTFTKYEQNPIINSKERWNSNDTRDPVVFKYEKENSNHWVMVLYEHGGHSIYTSNDLKEWKYESHTAGFWECPQLFELAVDGNPNNTKWVMAGAAGIYTVGSFDGKTYMPETGKSYYARGSIYAAQTFSNIPASDGRCIQIGWGRISHPDMVFNQMMLLPTELTLRTTKNGLRLFSYPVEEVDKLQEKGKSWTNLDKKQANEVIKEYNGADYLRIKMTLAQTEFLHAGAGLNLFGQELLNHNMTFDLINGIFYASDDLGSMKINADIIIDKTSIEVFIDEGAYSYSMERRSNEDNNEGFHFWGNNIEITNLEVFPMKSIW